MWIVALHRQRVKRDRDRERIQEHITSCRCSSERIIFETNSGFRSTEAEIKGKSKQERERERERGRGGGAEEVISRSWQQADQKQDEQKKEEEWTSRPNVGQETQRQRCPSPTSFQPPSFPQKWKAGPPPLPPPHTPSPLLNLSSSPPLPTTVFFNTSSLLHFSLHSPLPLSPLSLPCLTLLNQQHVALMETRPLIHSPPACRLHTETLKELWLVQLQREKEKRRWRETESVAVLSAFHRSGGAEMDRWTDLI